MQFTQTDHRIIQNVLSDRVLDDVPLEDRRTIWFQDLSRDEVELLIEEDRLSNDDIAPLVPHTQDLKEFFSAYPMFRGFGWLHEVNTDAETVVYITGLEYTPLDCPDGIEQNGPHHEKYMVLKNEFFNRFKDAYRIELSPDSIVADYAYWPDSLDQEGTRFR